MTIGTENEDYGKAADAAVADTATDKVVTESAPATDESSQTTDSDASATAWNGEQFAFDSGGQRIVPKSQKELILWAAKGRNYSQRAAELNKRQAELDERGKKFADYDRLSELFKTNPAFQKQIFEMAEKSQQGEATRQEEAQLSGLPEDVKTQLQEKLGVIDSLKTELGSIRGELDEYKKEKEDRAIDTEIDSLREKYKDIDWDTDNGDGSLMHKVLTESAESGLPLEKSFKIINFDSVRLNTEAETKKREAERLQNEKKAGIVSSGQAVKPPQKPVDFKNTSYHKLAELAESRMK